MNIKALTIYIYADAAAGCNFERHKSHSHEGKYNKCYNLLLHIGNIIWYSLNVGSLLVSKNHSLGIESNK